MEHKRNYQIKTRFFLNYFRFPNVYAGFRYIGNLGISIFCVYTFIYIISVDVVMN